jgi:hypothetical protein
MTASLTDLLLFVGLSLLMAGLMLAAASVVP